MGGELGIVELLLGGTLFSVIVALAGYTAFEDKKQSELFCIALPLFGMILLIGLSPLRGYVPIILLLIAALSGWATYFFANLFTAYLSHRAKS